MAAVLASGSGAVLSHRSAAALHGPRPDSRPVSDVTTQRGNWRRVRGITRHSGHTLQARDATVVNGIPCTSLARTLLDLAEEIDRQGVRRACNQAEILRVFDGREMTMCWLAAEAGAAPRCCGRSSPMVA